MSTTHFILPLKGKDFKENRQILKTKRSPHINTQIIQNKLITVR